MAGCIAPSSLCAGCWDGVKIRELPVRVLSGLPPLTGGHGHHGVKLHTGLAHRLQCIGDWYQIITKKGLDWHNVIMFRLHTAANVKSISLPVPESRPSLWKLNNVVSVMCKVSAICQCPVHSHTVTQPGDFYFKTNKTWLGQFWCRIFIKISAAVDLLCLIGPHNSQHHLLLPRLSLTNSQEFTAQLYIQGSNWT